MCERGPNEFGTDTTEQSYPKLLRANILRSANHSRIGPFLAGFDAGSDNPYRNYAVPDAGADPNADDVAALIAAFEERNRRPRLEYIAEAAPEVEAALLASGFAVEKHYPILVCTPDSLRDAGVAGIDVALAQSDEDVIAAPMWARRRTTMCHIRIPCAGLSRKAACSRSRAIR